MYILNIQYIQLCLFIYNINPHIILLFLCVLLVVVLLPGIKKPHHHHDDDDLEKIILLFTKHPGATVLNRHTRTITKRQKLKHNIQ